MAKSGRKPGSLMRATCVCCGAVSMERGAANHRCQECRATGRRPPTQRSDHTTGQLSARSVVANAIRDGLLVRPSAYQCTDCAAPATDYDHRNYNEPLKVEPVCRSCNLRRGPAIPLHGSLTRIVARGREPYGVRSQVARMLAAMGHQTDVLALMPAKLKLEHWQQILRHLPEGV